MNNNFVFITLTKTFTFFQEIFHDKLSINLKGGSYFYKLLDKEDYFEVNKHSLFYNPKVRGSYSRLINGKYNEPETHHFINNITSYFKDKEFSFIEVGGNIGEFLVDLAANKQIKKIMIFEPQKECVYALEKTVDKNEFDNVVIIPKAVTDKAGFTYFESTESFSSSHISEKETNLKIETINLDAYEHAENNYILLLDAEGAELNIAKGGKNFINKFKPLIIFEYNHVTKECFKLNEMEEELGPDYKILRLVNKGKLDDKINENTWNLVAVNLNSMFKEILNNSKFIV